jgi:hypothetical protein
MLQLWALDSDPLLCSKIKCLKFQPIPFSILGDTNLHEKHKQSVKPTLVQKLSLFFKIAELK